MQIALSEETRKIIKQIARQLKISEAEAIEIAIQQWYELWGD
ncbi:MAG: ribbon-helix-helix protein, CopG family [Desulfobacterales bacterium]|nr:ribbon-helix-helix protein, CopG family [Desulfobacterales bacterium]